MTLRLTGVSCRPPNSTGAYELDLSLVNDFSAAWRTMHLKTDVFCAGSVILPDKKGRQINVGGWSLDSTFGVRLYTPDGHEGVPSTNDWEEDFKVLSLQVCFISPVDSDCSVRLAAWPLVPHCCNPPEWNDPCHRRRDWKQRCTTAEPRNPS